MKIYLQIVFSFLFITVLCFSCIEQQEIMDTNTYFDLEKYVSELKESGNFEFKKVTKYAKFNGKQDSLILDNYDISAELEMIKKYNINKASLAGKYAVEEMKTDTLETILYTALEDNLLTRSLAIEKRNKELRLIKIVALQKSVLSLSKQTIVFAPNKSYQLISEDENKYSNDLMKEILIKF